MDLGGETKHDSRATYVAPGNLDAEGHVEVILEPHNPVLDGEHRQVLVLPNFLALLLCALAKFRTRARHRITEECGTIKLTIPFGITFVISHIIRLIVVLIQAQYNVL